MKLFKNETPSWCPGIYQHHFRLGDTTGLEVYKSKSPGRLLLRMSTWWRKEVTHGDQKFRLCVWSEMLGVFIGTCNYLEGRGIEVFSNHFAIGVTVPYSKQSIFRYSWHRDSLVTHVGWFGFKFDPPKFMIKRRDAAREKEMEEAAAYYDEYCRAHGYYQQEDE